MIEKTQEEIMKDWNMSETEAPLVSVKCMTYNQEKYISQCIDGFLMQKTTFPFEIWIHDDCSSDNTTDIVLAYAKKYPKIIKPILEDENQYSKPEPGAHHKKIDAAIKGKYIAFCEGDDYWIDENKLQMQVGYLESHSDYTMSFHNAVIKDLYANTEREFNPKNFTQLSVNDIINCWRIPTASIVIRRDVYEKKMVIKPGYVQGDIIIHMAAFDSGNIKYFNNIMSVYRYGCEGSATERSLQDSIRYLNANSLLWSDINTFYNYKYDAEISKKLNYNKRCLYRQKMLKRFYLLRLIKRIRDKLFR